MYDCDGYVTGVSLAERLRLNGMEVEIVTPFPSLAPYMEHTFEASEMTRRLEAIGVAQSVGMVLDEINPGGVVTSRAVRRDRPEAITSDSVVLVTQRVSNDRLYRTLQSDRERLREAGIDGLYRIGDCVVPRLLADVIFDGHRLARELDAEDPSKARPFIRETRVVSDEQQRSVGASGAPKPDDAYATSW